MSGKIPCKPNDGAIYMASAGRHQISMCRPTALDHGCMILYCFKIVIIVVRINTCMHAL